MTILSLENYILTATIVGPVIGALILPHMAHALVGGLGMIAATGAASLGFGAAFGLGYAIVSAAVFALLSEEQKNSLIQFMNDNPASFLISQGLLLAGLNVAGIYLTCILMGQAFLPFLACFALGSVVTSAGLALISKYCLSDTKTEADIPTFNA